MASGLFATGALTTTIGLADGGGITYGVPLGFALSKSMTTVLRSARTRCATACDRLTRTRGLPPASPGSIATPAIGPFAFAAKLARPSTETLRKSIYKVSGSGRVATYGTGSLASITSDVPALVAREVIVLRRTIGAAVVPLRDSSLDAPARAPASTTATRRA